jgi:hypothetical protein
MEQLTKSKVTNLQSGGTWEAQSGTMFRFEIALENGNVGEYSSSKYKSIEELPFTIGSEIEYEWKDGKFPKVSRPQIAGTERWKPSNNSQSKMNFNRNKADDPIQKMICRQSSLQRAVEILVHNKQGAIVKPSEVIKYADYFTNWVMEEDKTPVQAPVKEEPKFETQKELTHSASPQYAGAVNDDLPF